MVESATQSLQPYLDSDLLQQIFEAQSALAEFNFNLEEFMKDVANRMQRITRATGAAIELVEGDEMVYRAASGSVAPYVGLRLKINNSLSGLCVRDARILTSEDTSQDPRVDYEACKKVGAASMVVVPLFRWGSTVGVLKVLSTNAHAFGSHDEKALSLMSGLLGTLLGQRLELHHRAQIGNDPRDLAQRDPLTGLPNGTLFRQRLAQAITRSAQNKSLLALVYLDIDRLQPINDHHGREKGDALLRLFAARIGALLREADVLSRLRGDEFTVILENAGTINNVTRTVSTIIDASGREFALGGLVARVGASAGVATSQGLAVDPEDLIGRAESALSRAKKAGGASFRIV